jgi:hypothetical protein
MSLFMHMRKIFTLFIFLQYSLIGSGQKNFSNRFFDHFDITGFGYFDDASDSKKTWQDLISHQKTVTPYNFDSLRDTRGWFYFKINGGAGLMIRLQKALAKNATGNWLNNKLEWRAGLGYRHFAMSSDHFSNSFGYGGDTTKAYPNDLVNFGFSQHFADVQNTIVYKFPPSRRESGYLFFGAGFQYSLSVKSKIKEQYAATETKWNTNQRGWNTDTTASYSEKFFIKNSSHFYFLIPMGMELKFSEYFRVQFEATYFFHFRNKILPQESYSEGAIFSTSLRFKL